MVRAAILVSALAAQAASAQAFDLGPLNAPVAFATSSAPTDAGPFMTWLSARIGSLQSDGVVAAREHLYAILAADAKGRVRRGSSALPAQPDSQLAQLYEWGHRLGLPGARLVSRRLGFVPSAKDPAPIATPGFALQFDSLYSVVAESDGWMVQFPHYFMIGTATRQQLANGAKTSVLALSTLTAKDSSARAGASQATIMLLSAEAAAPETAAFWLQQLGIALSDTVANASPTAARTYRARDAAARMTKELVVFEPPGRVILAAYIGNDGTYETNRPHFLDLLKTLRVRSSR